MPPATYPRYPPRARIGFAVLLIEAAVFMTIWIFAHDKFASWLLGMAWSWGFIGVWGPVTAYTAEVFPTRIRAGPSASRSLSSSAVSSDVHPNCDRVFVKSRRRVIDPSASEILRSRAAVLQVRIHLPPAGVRCAINR
jgi:hypothetical protein